MTKQIAPSVYEVGVEEGLLVGVAVPVETATETQPTFISETALTDAMQNTPVDNTATTVSVASPKLRHVNPESATSETVARLSNTVEHDIPEIEPVVIGDVSEPQRLFNAPGLTAEFDHALAGNVPTVNGVADKLADGTMIRPDHVYRDHLGAILPPVLQENMRTGSLTEQVTALRQSGFSTEAITKITSLSISPPEIANTFANDYNSLVDTPWLDGCFKAISLPLELPGWELPTWELEWNLDGMGCNLLAQVDDLYDSLESGAGGMVAETEALQKKIDEAKDRLPNRKKPDPQQIDEWDSVIVASIASRQASVTKAIVSDPAIPLPSRLRAVAHASAAGDAPLVAELTKTLGRRTIQGTHPDTLNSILNNYRGPARGQSRLEAAVELHAVCCAINPTWGRVLRNNVWVIDYTPYWHCNQASIDVLSMLDNYEILKQYGPDDVPPPVPVLTTLESATQVHTVGDVEQVYVEPVLVNVETFYVVQNGVIVPHIPPALFDAQGNTWSHGFAYLQSELDALAASGGTSYQMVPYVHPKTISTFDDHTLVNGVLTPYVAPTTRTLEPGTYYLESGVLVPYIPYVPIVRPYPDPRLTDGTYTGNLDHAQALRAVRGMKRVYKPYGLQKQHPLIPIVALENTAFVK